jgi:hypothetical protein
MRTIEPQTNCQIDNGAASESRADAYQKPTLTRLGSFKELTRGNAGSIADGGGASMQMMN